ncbi:hypothetical protein OSCI_3250015 [Kamptonema sp. PCC 6506]|nr:hypothetical protein OSCI_3250015 [Kamptonema sp. PCC 6506]
MEIAREIGDRGGEGRANGNLGKPTNPWETTAWRLNITRNTWK